MSRSYRKTPIIGNTKARSEKKDKQLANRRFRRTNAIDINEVSNVWCMNKDGKSYWNDIDPADMRK